MKYLFLSVLFLMSCIQEEQPSDIINTKVSVILDDIPQGVTIDSVRVNVIGGSIDSSFLFTKDIPTDTLQFVFRITENSELNISYEIYAADQVLKSGDTEYSSGNFTAENREAQAAFVDSTLIDSLITELEKATSKPLIVGFQEIDTLNIAEGDLPTTITLKISDNQSKLELTKDCPVYFTISSQFPYLNSSDYQFADSVVFKKGAKINSFKEVNLTILEDNLVEGVETFNIKVDSTCDEFTLSTKTKRTVNVEDMDSVQIKWVSKLDTLVESDTVYNFQLEVMFNKSQTKFQGEYQLDFTPSSNSKSYTLPNGSFLLLDNKINDRDTLNFPVEFTLDNQIVNEHVDFSLTLVDNIESIQFPQNLLRSIHFLNDDFEYYFISDTTSHQVHILDHEQKLIRSRDFDTAPYDIDFLSSDSLTLSFYNKTYTWILSKDSLVERSIFGGESVHETGTHYYAYRYATPDKFWEIDRTNSQAVGFWPIMTEPSYDKNMPSLLVPKSDSDDFDVMMWTSSSDLIDPAEFQLHITNKQNFSTLTYKTSLIDEYTDGLFGAINHSNGKQYVALNNKPPLGGDIRNTIGYIFEVTTDSLLNLTDNQSLTLEEYNQWPIMSPRGMDEDPNGNILVLDSETNTLSTVEISSGQILVKKNLSSFSNADGLWDILFFKSKIEL